jgi:hypothetical protein
MMAKKYETVLKEQLNMAQFLLLTLLVGCLQQLRDMKLERLAEVIASST